MSKTRLFLWGIPSLLYVLFSIWYTNLGGPLTETEIQWFVDTLVSNGSDAARIAKIRRFMEEDTGDQFIMINALDMADAPATLPAGGEGADADALLNHYMEHMWPELIRRACHPVFFGEAIFDAMDVSGIDGAQQWSRGALMRYRSRRDMMEIASKPVFAERHAYKIAALDKTIAYPVSAEYNPGDLRFLFALILALIVSLVDLVLFRRG